MAEREVAYFNGAIIVEQGALLTLRDPQDGSYRLPGGALHLHEGGQDAIRRSVYEELSVHYEVERLAIVYERYKNLIEGDYHSITFYYLMHSRGQKPLPEEAYSQRRFQKVCWLKMADLNKYRLEPSFISSWLSSQPVEIMHIVSDERQEGLKI